MTETPPQSTTPENADPSMEDILASIRRILNEEETPADTPSSGDLPADDDVLVLDESMMVSDPEHDFHEPDPRPEPEPMPMPIPMPIEPPMVQGPRGEPQAPYKDVEVPTPSQAVPNQSSRSELMGAETAAAAASSVGSLVRTIAASRATQVYAGGPTLEDVVRAELRPLLKEWLDANLPPLVERLVRTEIERVVGRAVP
jgi:uncharacterized protein